MFREMRRSKQQLSDEENRRILERGKTGILAVLGDDAYPYTVPINYVFADGCIFMHSAMTGHKIDAIRNHDKASFCVIDADEVVPSDYSTNFRSVVAFGRIGIIDDEDEKMATVRLLGDKYNPNQDEALAAEIAKGFAHMHMIRLRIEHMTGKQSLELARMAGPLEEMARTYGLTPREIEIAMQTAQGFSCSYIADKLVVSESTVRFHQQNLYRKLNVHSRNEFLELIREA